MLETRECSGRRLTALCRLVAQLQIGVRCRCTDGRMPNRRRPKGRTQRIAVGASTELTDRLEQFGVLLLVRGHLLLGARRRLRSPMVRDAVLEATADLRLRLTGMGARLRRRLAATVEHVVLLLVVLVLRPEADLRLR